MAWRPGVTTTQNASGVLVTLWAPLQDPAWAPYVVREPDPTRPELGSPTDPAHTIDLQFPDLTTAETVLSRLVVQ